MLVVQLGVSGSVSGSVSVSCRGRCGTVRQMTIGQARELVRAPIRPRLLVFFLIILSFSLTFFLSHNSFPRLFLPSLPRVNDLIVVSRNFLNILNILNILPRISRVCNFGFKFAGSLTRGLGWWRSPTVSGRLIREGAWVLTGATTNNNC